VQKIVRDYFDIAAEVAYLLGMKNDVRTPSTRKKKSNKVQRGMMGPNQIAACQDEIHLSEERSCEHRV
jgi:hypothetical protein